MGNKQLILGQIWDGRTCQASDHLFLFETLERLLVTSFLSQAKSLGDVGRPLHLTCRYTHLSHPQRPPLSNHLIIVIVIIIISSSSSSSSSVSQTSAHSRKQCLQVTATTTDSSITKPTTNKHGSIYLVNSYLQKLSSTVLSRAHIQYRACRSVTTLTCPGCSLIHLSLLLSSLRRLFLHFLSSSFNVTLMFFSTSHSHDYNNHNSQLFESIPVKLRSFAS